MSQPAAWEPYTEVACPVCGWPLTEDRGPYPEGPDSEDQALHRMHCGWCDKGFDAR